MVEIKEIYYDIGNALKGVCDKVYARSRPKAVDERVGSYLVVALPYRIRNGEMDPEGRYNDFETTAQIEVYVRDRVSAKNPNGADVVAMSEKVGEVMRRFPIATERMVARRPRVTLEGDDGDGFGVAVVQADVRTR